MMSTRRKPVEPVVDNRDAPFGEDVRRWPDTDGSGSTSPSPLIHLLQTEGAHVIFIGRRRPSNADGRPACPDYLKDGARRAGRRQCHFIYCLQRLESGKSLGSSQATRSKLNLGLVWFALRTLLTCFSSLAPQIHHMNNEFNLIFVYNL